MPVEVVVPQIGEAISELRIVDWLKDEGDAVEVGDVLFEVDSDKAVVEVEAFIAGTLTQIISPAGSAVMPQDVVGIIVPEGEGMGVANSPPQTPAAEKPTAQMPPAQATEQTVAPAASPIARRIADSLNVDLREVEGTGPRGRIMATDVRAHGQQLSGNGWIVASPLARRIAREQSVDLAGITGTGVGGMIVLRDVEQAAGPSHPTPAVPTVASGEVVPFSRQRQVIARRMGASKQQVPHFYLMADVDMTGAGQLRAYCRETLGWERPPTYTDIIVRACGVALAGMPALNINFGGEGIIRRESVDIGVAVGLDDGLIVPVLKQADTLSLQDTSAALRELVRRARDGRLKNGDLGHKSLTVSNLGMHRVDAFVAIIDPPDPMILAVGRIADRAVPVDGRLAIKPMCTLTLSVDHRVLDGVQGARFLERVAGLLETPYELMR
jgi:pyruvate dehydrogenase E2 component (dihydrolipoamide acetyltransferase)